MDCANKSTLEPYHCDFYVIFILYYYPTVTQLEPPVSRTTTRLLSAVLPLLVSVLENWPLLLLVVLCLLRMVSPGLCLFLRAQFRQIADSFRFTYDFYPYIICFRYTRIVGDFQDVLLEDPSLKTCAISTAFSIVRVRAKAMHDAATDVNSGMINVKGLNIPQVLCFVPWLICSEIQPKKM